MEKNSDFDTHDIFRFLKEIYNEPGVKSNGDEDCEGYRDPWPENVTI